MDFLKKNWPLLLIPIIGIIVYYVLQNSNKKSAGADSPSNTGDLDNNNASLAAWGVTASWNTAKTEITLKGQGAGNGFQHTWSKSELMTNFQNMEDGKGWGTYSQLPLVSEYSADGDFYIGVIQASEVANSVGYLYIGVYDPNFATPNPPDSTNAKAALRLDGIKGNSFVITVLKEPQGKYGLN